MIELKTVVGGIAIAGSLGLATLGLASVNANAEPTPFAPQLTTNQDVGHATTAPSPYEVYGGATICGTPGMYFVNVCTQTN